MFINKTCRLVLITRSRLIFVRVFIWVLSFLFHSLSTCVAFLPSVDLNHCQQQGRKARRWKNIWCGVLLKNEKRHKAHYKILQNSFHRIYWSPSEKSFQFNKVPQTSGMVWTQNGVKSHPIQWNIFPLEWKKFYVQFQVASWAPIHVLLVCVLISAMWNGVELTGVDESLSFSCPAPVLCPEKLAVAQGLLAPSASKSHYFVILEASHQRGPCLWDHPCQLCSQSQETNGKYTNSK